MGGRVKSLLDRSGESAKELIGRKIHRAKAMGKWKVILTDMKRQKKKELGLGNE